MKIEVSLATVIGLSAVFAVIVGSGQCSAQTTVTINSGQTLTIANLQSGSFQGTNFTLGPTTTFEINQGGRFGNISSTTPYGELDFLGSTVDANSDGIFGFCINPNCGVVKNLNLNVYEGGQAFSTLQIGAGTVANIFGGTLGNSILETGSTMNVLGGSIGRSLVRARAGSTLTMSGGRFRDFDVQPGSDVTLKGGDFRLNGAEYAAPSVSLNYGDVLSGVLSDGSVFVVDPSSNLSYSNIKLVMVPLPTITVNDYVIDGTETFVPHNLRGGQSLTLRDGGTLEPLFYAQGGTIDVQGGSVGYDARVVESNIKISGGTFGDRFTASTNSIVDITGGDFEGWPWARAGSTWNIDGGSFGGLVAFGGSEVNISGGSFKYEVQTEEASVLNIRGGSFDSLFAYGGIINLFVKSAAINGSPLSLESGTPEEILERNFGSNLDVVLADGTPLSLSLSPDRDKPPSPFVAPEANLIVTLVPEPSSIGLWLLSVVSLGLLARRRK